MDESTFSRIRHIFLSPRPHFPLLHASGQDNNRSILRRCVANRQHQFRTPISGTDFRRRARLGGESECSSHGSLRTCRISALRHEILDDRRQTLRLIVMHHMPAVRQYDFAKILKCGLALGELLHAVGTPSRG